MTYIKSYKELIVWQKAMKLVEEIYKLTSYFPESERYGLTSQMRDAVIAIPSNIAEGYGRGSKKEYRYFFSVSYGSAMELETQLLLVERLNLVKKELLIPSNQYLTEVLKMMNTLLRKPILTVR